MTDAHLLLQPLARDIVTAHDPDWIRRNGGDPRGYCEMERNARYVELFNRFWDWQMGIACAEK